MFKLSRIAFGTALVLGGLAFGAAMGPSQAAGVAASGISVLPNLATSDSLVEVVRHRHRHGRRVHRHRHRSSPHRHHYRPRIHGPRYHHRSGRNRHHYRGYWYSFPFWMYSVPGPSYRSSHVRWCLNRYRSYNPRTDLFKGYDGRYHRCRSPYRR